MNRAPVSFIAGAAMLCAAAVSLFASAAALAISVVDDTGSEVRLAAPGQRIVSLSPHATELLFEIGAGSRVVGAVEFSDYPELAKRVPRVGSAAALDVERVARLKPDLVVGWASGNPPKQIEALRRLGIPVFLSEPRRLADIAGNVRRFGVLVGAEAGAQDVARAFEARLKTLKQRYASRPAVPVFYQIWDRPLVTVNGAHLISDVIELCGGTNVFEGLPQLVPALDVEAVVRADPEVIIASGADENRPAWLDDWNRWRAMTAVKRGNLFSVPPQLIQRQTPRIFQGAQQACEALEIARSRRPGLDAAPRFGTPVTPAGRPSVPRSRSRAPGGGTAA